MSPARFSKHIAPREPRSAEDPSLHIVMRYYLETYIYMDASVYIGTLRCNSGDTAGQHSYDCYVIKGIELAIYLFNYMSARR